MKKGLQIIVLIFIGQLIISCCKDVEYYDYSNIYITESSLLINVDEYFEMTLFAEDVQYMSSLSDFGFNSALATSCDYGWGGMKHPITDISITSSLDFDSAHVSNESLVDLFEYEAYLDDGKYEYRSLDLLNDYSSEHITLRIVSRPSLALSHVFEVKVKKSNGEEIAVLTEKITWEE